MNGAWADGAPRPMFPGTDGPAVRRETSEGSPAPTAPAPAVHTIRAGAPTNPSARPAGPRPGITDRVSRRVERIRQVEGLRGKSSRQTLLTRYVAYFLLIILLCGLTGIATDGVRFATGGGTFMLFSCAIVAATGAGATLFYVNLRNEIVERVRHYIFGIILIPGTLLALMLRALQSWEWINEGSLGSTLQMALPAIFLATVVLPALVFIKEILGIRTLHRSKLDDEEAVSLYTRQDGLQR